MPIFVLIPRDRQTSNVSKITHRGYLLKRSNQPYIELNEDDIVDDPDEFPDLPIMPGIFANRNDNCLETRYTTITALPPTLSTSFVHSSMEVNPPKNSIDKGLDAAAAFFGLSLEEDKAQIQPMMKTEDLDHRPPTQNLPIEPPRQKSSEPIKFSTRAPSGKYQEGRSRRESFQDALHRRHSDPKMNTEDSDTMDEDVYYQSSSHPSDFVNPIDGHIWRSKYCVLDDGILYFYRNMTDGESSQAESERGEDLSAQRGSTTNRSTQTSKISDLSKSPMARNFFRHYDSNETNDSASFMWEKRVVLDCVGAVRSAEQEYGPNSFQLQGIDNDGTSSQPADTLVLRARDHDSMNEWIFQFHRALASYVKDIMEAFGQSGAYVHIDYPLSTSTAVMETLNRGSEEKLRRLMTRSPRLPHPIQSVPSLSHGHGKHAEYRRKANPLKPKTSPEIGLSTLENGGTAFSKVTSSKDTSPATNLVHTSPGRSPHEIFLLPPQSQKVEREPSSTSQIREGPLESNFSPSLPTNQCSSERGNIASARRYVPPSLRNRSHGVNNRGLRSLEERETTDNPNHDCMYGSALEGSVAYIDVLDNVEDGRHMPVQRGGCADPNLVPGSILDEANIPRNASKLEKCRSEAFGSYGGEKDKVFWETGAVSECGIRDSNEDAYLIAHDLKEALLGLTDFPHDEGGMHESTSVNQSSMGVW